MQCKTCDMNHDGSYGSGVYCSRSCANSRGPRSDEVKSKIAKSLTGHVGWASGKRLSEEHKAKISKSLRSNPNRKNLGKNLNNRVSDDLIFIAESKVARHVVKSRLLENGTIEYKCSCCGLNDEWNGSILVLQLDHINGINNDNRIENLRFLCPNCHSQQETFSGRNVKRSLL